MSQPATEQYSCVHRRVWQNCAQSCGLSHPQATSSATWQLQGHQGGLQFHASHAIPTEHSGIHSNQQTFRQMPDLFHVLASVIQQAGSAIGSHIHWKTVSGPKPMLLASLTTASAAQRSRQPDWNTQPLVEGRTAKPRIAKLVTKQLPDSFLSAQRIAATVLEYYADKGEDFPRPCPHCGSHKFMVQSDAVTDKEKATSQEHGNSYHFAEQRLGGPMNKVAWGSRPLACDQCHRWWHYGCLDINAIDDLPHSPWFHCKSCRQTYLKLEAEAEKGEMPAFELGLKAGGYRISLMTDADHRQFILGDTDLARGDVGGVYQLLSSSLPSNLVLGYGNAASEYAGGKYALLLRKGPAPVAVATFDVYGPHAAQLHLLATAQEERGRGHARDIIDILEYKLSSMGVQRLIAQPTSEVLGMFTAALAGWEVMHPADAALVHREMPVAFYDAVMVEKRLN